jgi:hypothetical protein
VPVDLKPEIPGNAREAARKALKDGGRVKARIKVMAENGSVEHEDRVLVRRRG